MSAWWNRATCKANNEPWIFDPWIAASPTTEERRAADRVIAVYCDTCPVRKECLQDAVDFGSTGIRGGVMVTEDALRKLRMRVRCVA